MTGPFLSVRVDASWMEVSDEVQDRSVGSMVGLAESFWFGWRFTFFRHVELSALVGTALRHEFDTAGRLASYTRWSPITMGLTVGWLF